MNSQPEIQINLINYKLEQKTARQSMFLEWTIYFLVGLMIIGGIFLYNHGLHKQIENLNKENVVMQAELKRSTLQTSSLQATQKIKTAINNRSIIVAALQNQRTDYVPVLEELGQYYSGSGILLSYIDIQVCTIKINGYASSQSKLIDLLQSLKDSDYFSDPACLLINTNEETGEISFRIQMSLEEGKK